MVLGLNHLVENQDHVGSKPREKKVLQEADGSQQRQSCEGSGEDSMATAMNTGAPRPQGEQDANLSQPRSEWLG